MNWEKEDRITSYIENYQRCEDCGNTQDKDEIKCAECGSENFVEIKRTDMSLEEEIESLFSEEEDEDENQNED